MDNSIYEVERDDYVGFLRQLNREKMDLETYNYPEGEILKIKSKKTGTHLATCITDNEKQETHYYIFNMPDNDERIEPKGVMKLTLNTKEEVQAFINILNKVQAEAHKNDGNL